ncbi:uncharacterized protein VTP21DRAFT_7227 [Calcarisporiella thermophila]|uniref:uncharacterized protein n=1 Tax=Calcarisporiella thermophila TaxID=911321 RepID=UPI0037431F57
MHKISFILASFVALTAAAPFITQPITGTVWKAGSDVQITWTNGTAGTLPIKLMMGDPNALQQVSIINGTVDGAFGQLPWHIPENITAGNTYALALGNPPDIAYSGQFTIEAANAAPSSSAASSAAPMVVKRQNLPSVLSEAGSAATKEATKVASAVSSIGSAATSIAGNVASKVNSAVGTPSAPSHSGGNSIAPMAGLAFVPVLAAIL